MSFGVKLATPTQCAPQTLTWSGPPVRKALGMWVQGTNYFAEIIRENLTDTLGTVEWLCDVPAGAWIAFEILDLGNTSAWSASSFYQVQPGTTDACLRRNEGQKAVESMAALASSLSSASPQLFTYPATTTHTLASPTTRAVSSSSTALAPTSSSSSDSVNVGALAGGIAGGVVGVLALAAMLFLLFRRRARRRRDGQSPSSAADTEKAPRHQGRTPVSIPSGGGFFRTLSMSGNPVDAWRSRVQYGAPPSARTRVVSGATAGGGAGLGPLSAAPAQAASTGPRVGVPEVGEGGDYEAYRRAQQEPLHAQPYGGFVPGASASATRLLETYDHPAGGQPLEPPVARPPTRLTTPGGLTDFGGAGGAGTGLGAGGMEEGLRGYGEGGAGYASYSRGA